MLSQDQKNNHYVRTIGMTTFELKLGDFVTAVFPVDEIMKVVEAVKKPYPVILIDIMT